MTGRRRLVVCRAGELRPGGTRLLTPGGRRRILVARLSEDEYTAVTDYCPHQGGPLSGGSMERMWVGDDYYEHRQAEDRWVLICPYHNFETDARTGCPVLRINRSRAATYPVAVEDGEVVVYV